MQSSILLVFSLCAFFAEDAGERKNQNEPKMCPDPVTLQSDYVKFHYEEEMHQGLYYELAFKDVTQPRGCRCITSNKTIVTPDLLQDDFELTPQGCMARHERVRIVD